MVPRRRMNDVSEASEAMVVAAAVLRFVRASAAAAAEVGLRVLSALDSQLSQNCL